MAGEPLEDDRSPPASGFDPGFFAIGLGLLLAALVIFVSMWTTPSVVSAYSRVGPQVVPYLVAGLLALAGLGTLYGSFRGWAEPREPDEWSGVLWVGAGMVFQIAAVAFGFGFIIATAVLFATVARAFGRRAFLVDLAIGALLGLVVYFGFHNLLTLTLPQGPLERLLP